MVNKSAGSVAWSAMAHSDELFQTSVTITSAVCRRYAVDYKFTGFNHWGYKAGCTFAERPSRAVLMSTDAELQRFTCQRPGDGAPQELQCTVDLTSRGICTADSSHDGLLHVQVCMVARQPLPAHAIGRCSACPGPVFALVRACQKKSTQLAAFWYAQCKPAL